MKLHIQALHSFGSILADETGCEVARTSTEGCDPHGRPYVDAPDLAKDISHRVNCFEELREALQTLLDAVEGNHITVGDCNQARNALERAKQ